MIIAQTNTPSTLIHQWIAGLIKNDIDGSMIHPSFSLEEGMTLEEYKQYESEQFLSLSSIYDLDSNFSIQILNHYDLILTTEEKEQYTNKSMVFFYIINSLNKIVCKMNITLLETNGQLYIGSNNFHTQLVPKYTIEYMYATQDIKITHIALAIKTNYQIDNIICPQFFMSSFSKGDNFESDLFYHAQFEVEDTILFNQFYPFHLILETLNGDIIMEKRKVFFDILEPNLLPFIIEDNKLIVLNGAYPVHLSYKDNNDHHYNVEYPRHVIVELSNIKEIMLTDCLDNDWNIIL